MLETSQKQQSEEVAYLKKPVEMVVMRPKRGGLTLIGRRVYTMLLYSAQQSLLASSDSEVPQQRFTAAIPDILRQGEFIGGEHTLIKKYLREMVVTAIEWDSASNDGAPIWQVMTMLSYAKLEMKNGVNWLTWEFNQEIIDVLKRPEIYSHLNLKIATSIDSYVGTALYEICARYKNNPTHLTREQPVDWWIDTLSQASQDPKNRITWNRFKDRKLKKAIEDINTQSDLLIKMIERKQSREVVAAQFHVLVKKKVIDSPATLKLSKELENELKELCKKINIHDRYVKEWSHDYTHEQIKDALVEVSYRVENENLEKISSPVAYTLTILKAKNPKKEGPKKNVKEAELDSSALPKVELLNSPIESSSSLRSNAKSEFAKLKEQEQLRYMDEAVSILKAKQMFGVVELKAYQQKSMRPGIFSSTVIECFGQKTYGSAWPPISVAV
jgi:hypothetical protein